MFCADVGGYADGGCADGANVDGCADGANFDVE